MTKSVEDHVAEMLAEIQAQRPDPLEDTGNGHIPPSPEPVAEATANISSEQEPVHVFFVTQSRLDTVMLDAQSVEVEPETPAPPQPVTSRKNNARKNTVLSVGMFTICLLISILLLILFIVPQFLIPVATVTIIPKSQTVSTSATIILPARVLPALTLSQSQTAKATGKRHQDATQAQGTITFYNGLFTSQTIAAGTILTGSNGVQVITDQDANIPPDNPPVNGQATVTAHTVSVGSAGNIPAGDIDQQCCLTAVKAVNTEAFTGGQNAREYLVVTKADINQPATVLTASLEKSERAALTAQLNPGEALITPPCNNQIITSHKTGDEAREVTVTLSETCTGIVYDAHNVYTNATQLITSKALKRLGTGYTPVGDTQVIIIHAKIIDQARGIATISVKCEAIYMYQLSPGEKKQLLHLIAGRTKPQAIHTLLSLPGVQGASINSASATLPTDPGRITIVVVYRSA